MEIQLSDNCYEDFKILDSDGVNITNKLRVKSVEIKTAASDHGDPITTANIVCYLDKASIKVFDKDVNIYYNDNRLTLEQREKILEILEITPTK